MERSTAWLVTVLAIVLGTIFGYVLVAVIYNSMTST